jgi:DNA polymerase III delta prime subunit
MSFVGNVQLVAGSGSDTGAVLKLLDEAGIETAGNPDLSVETYQTFGIDDARRLRERAALRPAQGKSRTFVIAMSGITAEAQNALLKTLEEPAGNALFIIVHPAPETLLPTLRSRAQLLAVPYMGQPQGNLDAKEFLNALSQERLDMLKPLLEKGDDDKRDLGQILAFLAALERELAAATHIDRAGIEAVYRARSFLADRGALVKPLLEQLALLLAHSK